MNEYVDRYRYAAKYDQKLNIKSLLHINYWGNSKGLMIAHGACQNIKPSNWK